MNAYLLLRQLGRTGNRGSAGVAGPQRERHFNHQHVLVNPV